VLVLVMHDVVLIQMPFASLLRPSLALGLLKQYARHRRINTKVVYGNILFAKEYGLDSSVMVEGCDPGLFLGDWIFSGAAFGDFRHDHSSYLREVVTALDQLFATGEMRRQHRLLDVEKLCWVLRDSATSFVNTLAKRVMELKPRLVGCTSMFDQHCASLAILKRIRQLDPQVVTMLGGASCEDPMGSATKAAFPWVDFVVSGEADSFFGDFCRALLDRGPQLAGYELPPGVHGPAGSGISGDVPHAPFRQLDDTAVPDYDDYFEALEDSGLDRYVTPGLPIETSRGCWWGERHHCTFCGLNGLGMVFRSKSPARVAEELSQLAQRYGTKRFFFADNIIDLQYFKTSLPRLASEEEPYALFYEVKANLKREQLEQLQDAGVRWLQPGFESLHDSFLRLIDKGTTAFTNVQVLKWAGELGIRLYWNMLYGAPGESDEWFAEMATWVPLVAHLQPPDHLTRIRYQRYSPYHQRPEKYGLKLSPCQVYTSIYPVSQDVLSDLVYVFDDAAEELLKRDGPGLCALRKAIEDWRRAFWNPTRQRPVLAIVDSGDRMLVRDTRVVATAAEHVLEGLDCWIYRCCDQAMTAQGLLGALGGRLGEAPAWSDIEPALERLCAKALLLRINGRFLRLAIEEPIRSLPEPHEHPGGCYAAVQLVRDVAPRSLANLASRDPRDFSLSELFAPQQESALLTTEGRS
jgi:ribosomal peptide maturation radical SAM protein 1